MARVILITGKNRNAISAPLHRFVRRAFAFVWFTGIGRIAGEIRCSRRFQILACRDRDFGGHVSFERFSLCTQYVVRRRYRRRHNCTRIFGGIKVVRRDCELYSHAATSHRTVIGWSPNDKIKIEAEHIAVEIDCGLNVMNGDDRASSEEFGFCLE